MLLTEQGCARLRTGLIIMQIPRGYQKKTFYCSPEGFALLLGQCAALRRLAQSTTPFLASGKAKNEVFSLRIAHIALFYTINVFSDVEKRDMCDP